MTENAERLQNLIWTDLTLKDDVPSVEQIDLRAELLRQSLNAVCPVSDDEFEEIEQYLRSNICHTMGEAVVLRGEDSKHFSWYKTYSGSTFYWERYKKYLKDRRHWSQNEIDSLNNTTDTVMDELGDPASDEPFQRRGLLLGDVQSGKTATYTAICNKAVDARYKVVIVLSGTTEILRSQTQSRLNEEFVGTENVFNIVNGKGSVNGDNKVGVGKIPGFENDAENPIACFTSTQYDFGKRTAQALNFSLTNLHGAVLFVVKKNSGTLKNLRSWLSNSFDGQTIDYPLLLIDDEADNASINTNGPDKDPTTINGLIRDILNVFRQASYIAVTATPFANIFIDPYIEDDEGAKDLFPRHFITMLPVPENYIGPDRIFGNGDTDEWDSESYSRSEGEYSSSLVPIKTEEQVSHFAYKHKRDLMLKDLPSSLRDAIDYFILVNAITDFDRMGGEHRSMLINVSRFTKVHNDIVVLIRKYVDIIKSDLENYSQLPSERRSQIKTFKDLYAIWERFGLESLSGVKWEALVKGYLFDAARRIEVVAVNQSTGPNALDYNSHKEGYRVIAVGGNSLSRGLTLEGLCVSYFYRNTMMYDTLLQMGRWFGYRDHYDNLFKIWMGEDSIESYGYITDAVNELKNEILIMNNQKRTPEDFGLKVRNAPGALMVTARTKMRSAKVIKQPITVSGRMIESPRLKCNKGTVAANEKLCRDFIEGLSAPYSYDDFTKSHIWKNISKDSVAELVGEFCTHPWSLNFQSKFLSDYIKSSEKFKLWDVAIPEGGADEKAGIRLRDGRVVEIAYEGRRLERDENIRDLLKVYGHHIRIGSGGCARIGLEKDKIQELRQEAKARDQKPKDAAYLDATYLIEDRNPILLIHIIENTNVYDAKAPRHIFALGLGFPAGEEDRVAEYVVNTKEMEQCLDNSQEYDYDMEEDDDIDQ